MRAGLTAGSASIALPTTIAGHRLPRGRYLVLLIPVSPTGQPGRSIAIALKLVAV